jgi:hypothetical protein
MKKKAWAINVLRLSSSPSPYNCLFSPFLYFLPLSTSFSPRRRLFLFSVRASARIDPALQKIGCSVVAALFFFFKSIFVYWHD